MGLQHPSGALRDLGGLLHGGKADGKGPLHELLRAEPECAEIREDVCHGLLPFDRSIAALRLKT